MGSSVSASRVGALRRRWEEADKIIDGEREQPELDRDSWVDWSLSYISLHAWGYYNLSSVLP